MRRERVPGRLQRRLLMVLGSHWGSLGVLLGPLGRSGAPLGGKSDVLLRTRYDDVAPPGPRAGPGTILDGFLMDLG